MDAVDGDDLLLGGEAFLSLELEPVDPILAKSAVHTLMVTTRRIMGLMRGDDGVVKLYVIRSGGGHASVHMTRAEARWLRGVLDKLDQEPQSDHSDGLARCGDQ